MAIQDTIRSALGHLDNFPSTLEEVRSKHSPGDSRLDDFGSLIVLAPKFKELSDKLRTASEPDFSRYLDRFSSDELLPFQQPLDQLRSSLSQLKDRLKKRVTHPSEVFDVQSLFPGVEQHIDKCLATLIPIERQVDLLRQVDDLKNVGSPASDYLVELEEKLKKSKEVLEALAEQHAKVASFELADDQIAELEQCIKRHKSMSIAWLVAMAFALIIAARLIVWISAEDDRLFFCLGPIFRALPADAVSGVAFYHGVSKLLVASLAFGVFVITGRLYQTHCHNLTVNEQRLVAFRAFKKMLASLSSQADPGPREKLVTAAAHAIFDHGSSGFLPKGTNEFVPLTTALVDAVKKTG